MVASNDEMHNYPDEFAGVTPENRESEGLVFISREQAT